jgi:activator-of-BECN1-regulated-autophagy protein 1
VEGYIPPDISNSNLHLVVASCRINNDASVDVSRDGRLLVALVPSPRPGGHSKLGELTFFSSLYLTTSHYFGSSLGIYSLETSTLGQMLFSTALDQSPVSVSLSPSSRFLLVGLATKRFLTVRGESSPAAQVFRLPWEKQGRKDAPTCITLDATRYIYQTNEIGYVSINCIRWAPIAGQGMVYATNTGNLGILR